MTSRTTISKTLPITGFEPHPRPIDRTTLAFVPALAHEACEHSTAHEPRRATGHEPSVARPEGLRFNTRAIRWSWMPMCPNGRVIEASDASNAGFRCAHRRAPSMGLESLRRARSRSTREQARPCPILALECLPGRRLPRITGKRPAEARPLSFGQARPSMVSNDPIDGAAWLRGRGWSRKQSGAGSGAGVAQAARKLAPTYPPMLCASAWMKR